MAQVASASLVRQLGSLFDGSSVAGLSDRQLLERFNARRDPAGDAAFAALVARHGPMVLGVCRQLLGDRHYAEDAFQAVFLVLARKAPSLRDPELLGNWLYGVALRTAHKARGRLARRRQTEENGSVQRVSALPEAPDYQPILDREQAEALHREIDRLPGSFRLAVVLCYFEGLTLDEAANRLRWPAGTLRSRLARAREKLRLGLTRRGVALPAAALGAVLAPRLGSASVSSHLCDATTRAATAFAAHHAAAGPFSPAAASLAQAVLQSILLHKLRLIALSVLLLAVAATGAGVLTHSLAMKDERMKTPEGQAAGGGLRSAERQRPAATARIHDTVRFTVTGRVLDPQGKPAAGAPIDIIGVSRTPDAGTDLLKDAFVLFSQGAADGEGRFRVEASHSSSVHFSALYALAGPLGPGSAFGSVSLHPDEQSAVEVRLQPEQVIRGRLVDISGQPAAGVEVRLHQVLGVSKPAGGGNFDCPVFNRGYVLPSSPEGLRAWPKAVTTDNQGRFVLAGIGRGLIMSLFFSNPRFAQQNFNLDSGDLDDTKEIALALHPARIIEGRALAADSGQPIPNAVISVRASSGMFGGMVTTKLRADDQGRFKITPFEGDYFRMRAFAPEGQPYLVRKVEIEWTKGAINQKIDLTLPRGVLIRGKVAEGGTGRPVSGATVQFFPMNRSGDVVSGFEAIVASKDDGSFQMAVPPGKGHLMILGPAVDYIPQEIGGGTLYGSGSRGGMRFYAHDIVAYEVKSGDRPHEIKATLRRGTTVKGRMLGPEGQTVVDAVTITRQPIDPLNLDWQAHSFAHARDGWFELHGFDPEKPLPVYFLDSEHEWGAATEFSGKQATKDVSVRLQTCGKAIARFVGPDGTPLAKLNVWPYFQLLMTPGSVEGGPVDRGDQLQADSANPRSFDLKHYGNDLITNAHGRVTMPALIPGARYRISDWSTVNVQNKGVQLRKDFTVKPGETVDLGDILVENPQS